MENHAAFSTLVGFGACLGVYDVALSSARATGCASHGASLFFARGSPPGAKKSKQKKARPFIRVRELCSQTSLLPPALRGPAYKGHPWPFTPLAASMPLAPLRAGSTRPAARGKWCRLPGCAGKSEKRSRLSILQATRTPFPFRRPNAGVTQGDARHGRRARNEGRGRPGGTSLRDVPLEQCRSEGSLVAQRPDPDVGVAFSLVTFSWRGKRK